MKADPCLNPACMALNIRADRAPIPTVCPRCGGELLRPRPLTLVERIRLEQGYHAAVRAFARSEPRDEEVPF